MPALERVTPDLFRLSTVLANVYFVRSRDGGWVLVDAGLPGFTESLRRSAAELFGATPPRAIILTHGHFDHVGALPDVAEAWGVPIYAHPLELPFLTGRTSYPPPDPTVGGGLMSWLSPLFPRGPFHFGSRVRMLPRDGSVPSLPGWRWIHTPGHAPGHVSLFRDSDRTLIAGDAVVTTKEESVVSVLTGREMVWRPPAYFTIDWVAAASSVESLAELEPEVLASGHGRALAGGEMRRALHQLADHFDEFVPAHGRYIANPARPDDRGLTHVAGRGAVGPLVTAAGVSIAAMLAAVAVARARRRMV